MLFRPTHLLAAIVALLLLLAPSSWASVRIPTRPVLSNPADGLLSRNIDPVVYQSASRCLPDARHPGTERFAAWLQANAGGAYRGAYRCEVWGKDRASLHAEKRAVDWHLDVTRLADRRQARRLIKLLTAPDAAGNRHALARRMGVQEIIWDCGYWGAGMASFRPYSPCLDKTGKPLEKVSVTVAHRDHIHFGLTKDGALGRTSFWQRR